MDDVLNEACRRHGWVELYRHFSPEGTLFEPQSNGTEYKTRSPFPGSTDKTPSLSVNSLNGYFADFHMGDRLVGARGPRGGVGGNLVQYIGYVTASPDQQGRLVGDFGEAERQLRLAVGLSAPVDASWLAACQIRLASEGSEWHSRYTAFKPSWSGKTLAAFGVGWDAERGRLVIPVKNRQGRVVNCRMYRPGPGAGAKIYWLVEGVGPQNLPFPHEIAWERTGMMWFLEGEGDVLTLLSLGIPAFTGTMGAGSPVPWLGLSGAEFVTGRNVIVCTDEDTAGRQAAPKMLAAVQPYAASIRNPKVPDWDGSPAKRDITDWVERMLADGRTVDECRRAVIELGNQAEPMGAEAAYDSEPLAVTFEESLEPANLGRRMQFTVRVVSKAQSQHVVPYQLELSCRENRSYCRECPMAGKNGNWSRVVDHRSPTALALMMVDDEKALRIVKRHMRIPEQCPEFRAKTITAMDAQILQVGPPHNTAGLDAVGAEDAHTRRTEMFIIRAESGPLEPGYDYEVRGFVYPAPRNQKAVLVTDRATRVDGGESRRTLSDADAARLRRTFAPPGMTVMQALHMAADDLAASVTGIRMRQDLHMLYRSLFHSPLAFDLAGEKVERGWIEAFVIGDTRCGKSAAFKHMSRWYGTGVLVDCKMQTVPGLLGAVETSAVTGERYVLPGIVPMNDGRGPVCFDEFTGPRYGRATLMEAMSSTRAEGVVRINKAAHASFRARVRSVWLANPGDSRLMADIPGTGVERVRSLVGQPEDVARFDIAMAVTQRDVPLEVLLNPVPLERPVVPMEDARLLLEWSRAREPEDFTWEPAAIALLAEVVRRMVVKYDQSIPLVEAATQRHKVAKLAAANAMASFSSPDGRTVVVTDQHIASAYSMFVTAYNKPSFGYDKYSERKRDEATIVDEDAVRRLIDQELGDQAVQSLRNLQRLDTFTDKTFKVVCHGRMDNTLLFLKALAANRCIEATGHADNYRVTRAFIGFMEQYIASNEQRPLRQEGTSNADGVGRETAATAAQ